MKKLKVLGMITLNEGHNLKVILPIAKEIFDKIIVVDSGSKDDTKEICEKYNIDFFYRDFDGFGNQWNYLLGLIDEGNLFVKMDPDERYDLNFLEILNQILTEGNENTIYILKRRWHLLGKPLLISDNVERIWFTNKTIKFSSNSLNERPVGYKHSSYLNYTIEHLDSKCLSDWIDKNNKYSSLEADNYRNGLTFDTKPGFNSSRAIKMLIKKHFFKIPFRHVLVFFYFFLIKGLCWNGYRGYLASLLWTSNYIWKEIKVKEKTIWK